MINNVVLMGRLTHEPELKKTQNDISVLSFSVACDRNYQTKDESRQTDFISCRAWRKTAEFIAKYFHKGDMIALAGSLCVDNYTDQYGNKKKAVNVVADEVSFCGGKSDKKATDGQSVNIEYDDEKSDFIAIDDNDDLPF